MKVAVLLGTGIDAGGGFQYELKVCEMLRSARMNGIEFVFCTLNKSTYDEYRKNNTEIVYIKESIFEMARRALLRGNYLLYRIFKKLKWEKTFFESYLIKEHGVDLVYFLSPTAAALDLSTLPFVITVWDLCHRTDLEFPEVSADREFERKEILYQNALKKAVAVVVDSKVSFDLVRDKYLVDEHRIKILPYLPTIRELKTGIDIKKKYKIGNNYVYYPAQFWPHKNHVYILKALAHLKNSKGIVIDAAFSGGNKGNLEFIKASAIKLGIAQQVHFLGFVPNEDIPNLYKSSLALVMPTYLGPTNIPPLEAFAYGVPVCYSGLEGLKDQVNGAAFLMDLEDPSSLARHLETILAHDPIVNTYLVNGRTKLQSWTEADFVSGVEAFMVKYKNTLQTWKDIH